MRNQPRFLANAILIGIALYFVLGIAGRLLVDRGEVFPFFRWSLYSRTPQGIEWPQVIISDQHDRSVRLNKVADQYGSTDVAVTRTLDLLYRSYKRGEITVEQLERSVVYQFMLDRKAHSFYVVTQDLTGDHLGELKQQLIYKHKP